MSDHEQNNRRRQTSASRKRAEKELLDSIGKLRAVAAHLQRTREEERTAMAREIHNEVAQSLTGVKFDLARLLDILDGEKETIRRRIESLSKQVDATVQAVRRIASELRPPLLDEFGLTAAVEWHLKELEESTGIRFDLTSDLTDCIIEPDRSIGIFRILQEAITNVARHSKAKTARVSLLQNKDRLVLKVSDTGTGILESDITSPGSLGLLSMRERAIALGGSLRVARAPAGGAEVRAAIPLRPLCQPAGRRRQMHSEFGQSATWSRRND